MIGFLMGFIAGAVVMVIVLWCIAAFSMAAEQDGKK